MHVATRDDVSIVIVMLAVVRILGGHWTAGVGLWTVDCVSM
jgi:hypothetical protein